MTDIITRISKVIDQQIAKLDTIQDNFSTQLPIWKDRTIRLLTGLVVEQELKLFNNITAGSWQSEHAILGKFLADLKDGIIETPELYVLPAKAVQENVKEISNQSKPKAKTTISNKVFIVHGHDGLAKTEVARMIEKLGLEAIILHEQANEGKTVIEKFERDALKVSAAVVIMTPDDVGYPKNKPDEKKERARQNVILELGYFSGVLGRENVCVVYKGEVEIPSDYLGVVYVKMDAEDAWKFKVAKELKQAGLNVDLNNLLL